ncbi:LysR family transcriptional regulator [Pseudophaeobacter sp.]|uniref:LysR family transcriptional regulator n=1 Tax=Pseudophaeobacter sp. TaxID=1971739 RepID=UPI004057FC6E
MQRRELSELAIFVEVAKTGGFRSAAQRLNLAAGSVSEAVNRFEDRLGLRLFERTTRAVSLTEAGAELFQRSQPALQDLEEALADVQDLGTELSGTLRLSAPLGVGPVFLDQLLAAFSQTQPSLRIEITYTTLKADLVSGSFDAAIRSETLLDPETYALPIGPPQPMAIVAAPSYLAKAPPLTRPEDLTAHLGICFAIDGERHLASWRMVGADGTYSVMPRPRMISNDVGSILTYAQAGLGLAYVFRDLVTLALKKGGLVEVLPGQAAPLPRFSLNYLSKRHIPLRLQRFVDFIRKRG